MIGILVVMMSASAVFAEEAVSGEVAEQEDTSGGLLEALFGEGGTLNEVIPEETDIDAVLGTAKEQLNRADGEIEKLLDKIYDMTQNEAGSFSPDTLKEYADDLLGKFIGGEEDFDISSLDAYFEISSNYNAAEEQYIKECNAEMMDPGDVQIVSQYPIYTVDYELEDVEITNLASLIQNNYKLDDENQLCFISGARDIVLFKHQKNEEGNYAVVEATFTEDGENYTSSLEKMCDEVGITLDECFEEIAFAEAAVAYDLEEYLNNHPDIKGIEYQGEIRTAEELDEIFYNAIDELYPSEEALAEEGETQE